MQILSPPWTTLGKKLESTCRKALFDFNLAENPPICVALSGGADSIALLLLLNAISGKGFIPFNPFAIHVENRALPNESLILFMQDLCERLQIPLIIKYMDLELNKLECYRCSRARRKIIFEEAKKQGASCVAFGHHRDDNAETFLLNILHKGECAAILPKIKMHNYGITIIRPLIYIAKADILNFISLCRIEIIPSICPKDKDSSRKVIKAIIAKLQDDFPSAQNNLASAGLLYGSKKALNT